MLAVIVGGGRGGSYLAQDLQSQGYQVKVVDRRPDVVAKLRQEIDGEVICGDGCTPEVLEQVGAAKADLVVAITHDDEDNLVICRLAKHHFNVPPGDRPREQPAQRVAVHQSLGRGRCHQPGASDRQGHRGRDRPRRAGHAAQAQPRRGRPCRTLSSPRRRPCRGKAIRDLSLPRTPSSSASFGTASWSSRAAIPAFEAGDEVLAVSTVKAEPALKETLWSDPHRLSR